MVGALVLSSAATGFVAARLAQDALSRQARELAKSHLRILQEVFGQRERNLLVNLRSLAETINVGALTDPRQHNELVGLLGRATSELQLDLLEVVDGQRPDVQPLAWVGRLAMASELNSTDPSAFQSASRLIATKDGAYVQAVPVAIGATPMYLVGGFNFDEAFAYNLRRQLGDLDEVLLVVSGKVVGSTLAQPLSRPPAIEGSRLPPSPASAQVGPARRLVAYVPVGQSNDALHSGALGVVETDPVKPLTQSLARQRWVTAAALTLVAVGLALMLFRYLMRPLVRLSRTAGLVAAGDPTASFSARGADEVARLATALENMRVQLANRLLLIERQATELQESSRRAVTVQDEERQRIARDLHDGMQQQLVVLRMRLGMFAAARPGGPGPNLDQLAEDLDGAIEQLREVSHALYPSILMDRGLTAALHSYVSRMPISTKLKLLPDPLPRLPLAVESGAYFMLCEALTNALKHAEASEVTIEIRFGGECLEVSVSDNGRGLVLDGGVVRSGLLHMEDRARSFGGRLTITSAPGSGTKVSASFLVEP
jgi:signal transduction histidine kinase